MKDTVLSALILVCNMALSVLLVIFMIVGTNMDMETLKAGFVGSIISLPIAAYLLCISWQDYKKSKLNK